MTAATPQPSRTAAPTGPTGPDEPPTRPRSVRPARGPDLAALADYAELYASVADAAALLEMGEPALQCLLDDGETPAARAWRQGRARARLAVRRAQFAQMEKNATLAIHLGKELLGQDGGGAPGPVTFVVDTGIRRDG